MSGVLTDQQVDAWGDQQVPALVPITGDRLVRDLNGQGRRIINLLNQTPNEVWISAQRMDGQGLGTQLDPFDGSTQPKLDALMLGYAGVANMTFRFGPGTFSTKGSLIWVPSSGWELLMGNSTVLQLAVLSSGDTGTLGAAKIMGIFGVGGALTSEIVVEGGTFDMNMQNQTQPLCPSAVQLICNGLTLRNFRVINFGNTSPTNAECFLVSNFSNGSRDGIIMGAGVLVDGVEITQPAAVTNTGTLSPINPCGGQNVTTAGSLSNGWFENVTVRNCFIHDITFSTAIAVASINIGGWAKGVHIYHNRFANLTGNNARYCVYQDTGSLLDVKIENNQYENVMQTTALVPVSSAAWVLSNITITREMANGTGFAAVNVNAGLATISNLTIEGNNFIAAASTGVSAQGVANLRIKNNVIDNGGADVVTTSSTVAECYLNRHIDGSPCTGDLFTTAKARIGAGGTVLSNYRYGTATLTSGSVTVADTATTNSSVIICTGEGQGGNVGFIYEDKASRSAGVSFKIKSSNASDTQTVMYQIAEP